jgi:putative transcriptional regulator
VAVKHDPELEQFQNDLMASVHEMKAGKAARETRVALSRVAEVRASAGLSQKRFAELMGVSPRTLQQWEQGRREPAGAAKTLLRVAEQHPEVLRELAAAHG